VEEYIEYGRKQLQEYLQIIEKETGKNPHGYLVWSVGISAIRVEAIK